MRGAVNLSLKQLEAFIWAADLGSFSRAAEILNTTQPNISARISSLEAVLGVKLMNRDAGSVRLTAKGRALLAHARDVLRATEGLIEASGTSGLIDGTLRLGVTELITHTWLRRFLKALKEAFPNVTVELLVDVSVHIEKELFEHAIDLAFHNEPFRHRVSGQQDLGTYPMIWVAAPEIARALPNRPDIPAMAAHAILTPARSTRLHEEVEAHFGAVPGQRVQLVPSSNLSACLHMSVDGMGIAILPEAMVMREMATGELVRIAHDWSPQPLRFQARYDAQKSSQFVARAAEIAREAAIAFQAEHP
ncbi:MAG: LysR family transcriptional regulator [Pseudomonadota bacterium]